jgi:adenylate kinase family enzyme
MGMLLCIGGPGRAGKSTLARMVSKRMGIGYTSFDFTTTALKHVLAEEWSMDADKVYSDPKYGELCDRLVEPFLGNVMKTSLPYIVESVRLTPEMLMRLKEQTEGKVHSVFLGYKDISVEAKLAELQQTPDYPNAEWFLEKRTREQQEAHLGKSIARSKELAVSAPKHGFHYVDTSVDISQKLQEAFEYIIQPIKEQN